jgi:hypothetical protein
VVRVVGVEEVHPLARIRCEVVNGLLPNSVAAMAPLEERVSVPDADPHPTGMQLREETPYDGEVLPVVPPELREHRGVTKGEQLRGGLEVHERGGQIDTPRCCPRRAKSGEPGQGGQDVNGSRDRLVGAGAQPGRSNHKRDIQDLGRELKPVRPMKVRVVAEVDLAMVRREDDNALLGESTRVDSLDQFAEFLIEFHDARLVEDLCDRAELRHLRFAKAEPHDSPLEVE